jgi:uncharacterized delta-60 repeat protein
MRRDLSQWFSSLSLARRSPAGRRMARKSRDARVALTGGEPLDSRKMLAVTANLASGVLTITLADSAADVATIQRLDATDYEVTGTGFSTATYAVADVSKVVVAGTGKSFTVSTSGAGDIEAGVSVAATIATTTIADTIDAPAAVGGVSLSSPLTEITASLEIATTNENVLFAGAVRLVGANLQISTGAGAGNVTFQSYVYANATSPGGLAGTLSIDAGTGLVSFQDTVGENLSPAEVSGALDTAKVPPEVSGSDYVWSAAPLDNGQFMIGGEFSELNGQPWSRVARLNADGSLDTSFTPPTIDKKVFVVKPLADGKTMIGGRFQNIDTGSGPQPWSNVARLNADGTLDTSFTPPVFSQYDDEDTPSSDVRSILPLENGQYLVGGDFRYVDTGSGYQPWSRVARLNADGSLDTSFTPPTFNQEVYSIVDAGDGTYIVAGHFRTVNGDGRFRVLARLLEDGSLDESYVPAYIPSGLHTATMAEDGKVLIGGIFTSIDGQARTRVARMNADGSLDESFVPPEFSFGYVWDVDLLDTGKVLVTGEFRNANGNPQSRVARLNADGSLDTSFVPPTFSQVAYNTAVGVNGGYLVVGAFWEVNEDPAFKRIAFLTAPENLLNGVRIESAGGVTSTSPFYLEGLGEDGVGVAFDHGIQIDEGVNNVSLTGGGTISRFFTTDGQRAGIRFAGGSTNSTISGFAIYDNNIGILLEGPSVGTANYAGTKIIDNQVGVYGDAPGNEIGIFLEGVNATAGSGPRIQGNRVEGNLDVGVLVTGSSYALIDDNLVAGNGGAGIRIDGSSFIELDGNEVSRNGELGVAVVDGEDVAIRFSIIDNNSADGILFSSSTGVIEGNEIFENGEDGILVDGGENFNGIVDVLGNIIRENGDDGIDFREGYFGYDLFDVDADGRLFSVVGGNTIERNDDDGVAMSNVGGVQVGGRFPSDINFINLNGSAGVSVSGAQPIDTPFVARGVRVLGNEIDSNEQYGIWLDSVEGVIVGGGNGDYNEWDVYAGPEAANTIRRNGIAGIFAEGYFQYSEVINNDISENPIGVMLTSASGLLGNGLAIGGPSLPDFPAEDSEIGDLGNRIFDNGEGIRATGDCYGTVVQGNLIEDNLTGATLASVRGLTFGYGEDESTRIPLPAVNYGNTVRSNNEGLRASGDLTDTVVTGNEFLDNTKVGIALQSAKNLTVGGYGEDSPNVISGSPIGLSASGTMTNTLVASNEFSENTIGISLSKATGMIVAFNVIDSSLKYGISVTGNNDGTEIGVNTVTNTEGQPGYEHGIYLNGAKNVYVGVNTVSDSKGAGIYVTGNTLGTAVQGNTLDGNRFGIALINATNAVIGGLGEDEGNTIVGGGDSAAGDYRDGIYASGTLTGSSITGTDITNASTGVLLESAQGLLITDTTVTDSQRFGLFARGNNAGTSFTSGTITGTGGVPSTEHGIALYDAQNLRIRNTDVSDSLGAGLYVTGSTTGTVVQNNDFDGNRFGIVLVNATNAKIGGDAPGEDNRIVGGGDPLLNEYRDGIYAAGTNTGSSITQTKIESCWTGINLESATGLTITDANVVKATGYGIYAKGVNTGTTLDAIAVEQDPVSSTSVGSILDGATGLRIANSAFTGDGTALYVIGGAASVIIEDSNIIGRTTGLNVLGSTGLTVRRNTITGTTNGLIVTGTSTGTSFTANTITATAANAAAASFYSVTGATFDDNATVTTTGNGFGLYATGDNSGTLVRRNVFNSNTVGVYLNAATNITLGAFPTAPADGNTISNSSFAGLQAAGACTNSFVYDTTWTSNAQNVVNTATGLTISPAAP